MIGCPSDGRVLNFEATKIHGMQSQSNFPSAQSANPWPTQQSHPMPRKRNSWVRYHAQYPPHMSSQPALTPLLRLARCLTLPPRRKDCLFWLMHSAAEITEGLPHWQGIPRCWETPPKGLLKFINQRRQKMQPQQPFTDRGFLGLRLGDGKV